MTSSLRSYVINEGLKLIFWIFWAAINGYLFYHTFMYYYTGPQFYYLHQMLGYGLCISRASATCINLNVSILLLPMCKRTVLFIRSMTWIIGRQARRLLDRGKSFHIYCGYMLCVFTVVHVGAHAYNEVYFSKYYNPKYKDLNVAKYANQNPLLMLVTSLPGITGILLVICVVIITTFATKKARKDKFNRFWKIHHLFIVFYILLFVHALEGVIKYQTNLDEHTPGCYMSTGGSNTTNYEPIVIPEPHPEYLPTIRVNNNPDLNSKMKKKIPSVSEESKSENMLKETMLKNKMVANITNDFIQSIEAKNTMLKNTIPTNKEKLSKNQFMLPITTMTTKTIKTVTNATTMKSKKTMVNKMMPKNGNLNHFIIPEPEPFNKMVKKDGTMFIIPEPEPFNKMVKKDGTMFIMPEPEPFNTMVNNDGSKFLMPEPHLPLGVMESTQLRINGMEFVECDQPPPVFESCPKETWSWIMFPLLLYIIERITRYLFYKQPILVEFKPQPSNVFSLKFNLKNFKAKPGQIIWLKCPSISKVESHPFTLTSVPCDVDPTFEVHVKVLGDWTENLQNLLLKASNQISSFTPPSDQNNLPLQHSNRDDIVDLKLLQQTKPSQQNTSTQQTTGKYEINQSNLNTTCHVTKSNQSQFNKDGHVTEVNQSHASTLNHVTKTDQSVCYEEPFKQVTNWPLIYIEGPTGSAMEDIFKYKTSLCIAGGIGVTPFASILNTLLKNDKIWTKMKLKRLHLVWICKNIRSFEWFAKLIHILQIKLWNENYPDFLSVQLYLTSPDIEDKTTNTDLERCRLKNGRPNLKELFQEITNKRDKSTVGVFCCGPRGLIKTVRKISYHQSCKNNKFFFNKEAFS